MDAAQLHRPREAQAWDVVSGDHLSSLSAWPSVARQNCIYWDKKTSCIF